MKHRIRLSVGIFHYFIGIALFATPWLGRDHSPEAVIDSVIGAFFIISSGFASYELGILRIMTYREHLFTTLAGSVALGFYSLFRMPADTMQETWGVAAVISVAVTSWTLWVHQRHRRVFKALAATSG